MSKIFENENQMILRVPEEIADQLNELFDKQEGGSDQMIDITPMITKNDEMEDVTQFE